MTITVDGAEDTLRTTTDAQGNFTLNPAPAGSFFVHIDGRTSPQSNYPNGSYYPSVGKRWEALAGRTDNLSGNSEDTSRGTIYLPKILGNALEAVSQSEDTQIEFPPEVLTDNPGLAGTELDVPANSLFADDGTRGGKVGIAPVAPDRLPSPLPPGLDLPMVITIQTDGATNFDRPVPICFPNLPDPLTGLKLPPGAKSALWSFNHDLGEWEIVGPMTVTEDGLFVKSDAGVGVRQPGWHGTRPGTTGSGPPQPNDPPSPGLPPLGGPFGPCSSPGQNRRMAGMCFQSGAAGVSAGIGAQAFVCEVPGLNVLFGYPCGVVLDQVDTLDPALAAIRARNCQQYYLDCNLHPENLGINTPDAGATGGGVSASIAPLTSLETEIQALMDSLVADMDQIDVANQMALTILGTNTTAENLTAEQLRLLKDLEQVVLAITGGKTPAAFYEQRQKRLIELSVELARLNNNLQTIPGFYRLELMAGAVVQRGKTESNGSLQNFILRPNANYVLTTWQPGSKYYRRAAFRSAPSGVQTQIPFGYPILDETDPDADGLGNETEKVLGTQANNPDTDGDGLNDGAEMEQGTNPLNGLIATTGVIAAVPTAGPALDVCTINNLAVTANGASGVSVFNVQSGQNPTRMADVNTPGAALGVASDGNYVAVADGQSGIAIVDVRDLAAIQIRHQVSLGSAVQAVTVYGPVAYASTAIGQIVSVDLASGSILTSTSLTTSSTVQDLAVWRDTLYALQVGKLTALNPETLAETGSLVLSGGVGAGQRRSRLFAGDGTLYATHTSGFNMVNVLANPNAPTLVGNFNTAQFGWKQIVTNGSGLGLAATSPNSTDDGPHDIDLYTLGADQRTPAFATTFVTPGLAAAVSLYNGLAYVADSAAGLQVINYKPYDSLGQVPVISLSSNFALDLPNKTGSAEEGKLMRLSATATDDVQVRNVEFYINGALALVDGNYPFEHRFTTPSLTATTTNFKVKAKATDTGGNLTWSDEYTITLVADATPPVITKVSPVGGAAAVTTLLAFFNETMDENALTDSIGLVFSGADHIIGTGDDTQITGMTFSYRPEVNAISTLLAQPLADGLYEATVKVSVMDLAGNHLASAYKWRFGVGTSNFWTAAIGGNWNNPANWSSGSVPTQADVVNITLPV
ncbi:MAG: Ig-like domain-containing protein, partial [Prosthecobacter sp.]